MPKGCPSVNDKSVWALQGRPGGPFRAAVDSASGPRAIRCDSAHSLPINPPSTLIPMSAHPSQQLTSLFETALNEFENRTGTNLLQHQVFNKLVACRSIESVLDILQEQSKLLRTSQGKDTTLMKWIKRAVRVLHSLSTSDMVVTGVSLVRGSF